MRNVPIPEHVLLDYLIKAFKLRNNSELAKVLGVTEGAISKIRHGINKVNAEFILRVYDKTDMSIEEIRALISEEEHLKTLMGDQHGSDTGKEG